MIQDRKAVEELKTKYPKGKRIMVDRMGNDPRPISPGTKGTVIEVDDIGTIHCDFDNGRRLGLVPGEDVFHVIEERVADKTESTSSKDLIRPMTKEEHKYCYSQSSQLIVQTGAIGYLRADMDTDGYGFFSSWNGFQNDLNTQEFKDEFDHVVNDLRAGKDNLLTNRSALFRYCNKHPEASIGDYGYSGFRCGNM